MNDSTATAWSSVFNTPLESGLRSAALLLAAFPEGCDIQRLVQYDYLIVHSADVDGGPDSIHPATPYRSGELLVRRRLVEQGLDFMSRRLVVEKTFDRYGGIVFRAGECAAAFMGALSSDYAKILQERADWVIERFQSMSNDELSQYMREK